MFFSDYEHATLGERYSLLGVEQRVRTWGNTFGALQSPDDAVYPQSVVYYIPLAP